jgi:AcrR family transcriptional regulator
MWTSRPLCLLVPAMTEAVEARRRDPDRRERILAAAADLVAERGYHEVGMTDIGAAAGITGSAIYRHFDGKSDVLATMFDRVIDDLSAGAATIVESDAQPLDALRALIRGQVRFVIQDRTLAQVYYHEIANLPAEDRRRLRRKQRLYLEEWVHQLAALRPGETDAELRARVHTAIGAIQSVLRYHSDLPAAKLENLIVVSAELVLTGTAPGLPQSC